METDMSKGTKPRRLGRGLSSLMGEPVAVPVPQPSSDAAAEPPPGAAPAAPNAAADQDSTERLRIIDINDIIPNKYQPRSAFDQESLGRLAESIRSTGVMQPIVVRRISGGGGGADAPSGARWELVAGERRWRAAAMAGLSRIPAVATALTDREAAEWSLVENLQREDLNAMERAWAFRRLQEEFGMSQTDIAEGVGLDRSSVANLVRLTDLEPPLQDLVAEGLLSFGHARALLSVPAGDGRLRLAERSRKGGWSVRRLESEASSAAAGGADSAAGRAEPDPERDLRDASRRDLERRLSEHLGTRVQLQLQGDGRKGRLVIQFFDLDQFDGLMSRIGFSARGVVGGDDPYNA